MSEPYLGLISIVEISGLSPSPSPSPRQTAQPTIQWDHTRFDVAGLGADLAFGLLAGAYPLLAHTIHTDTILIRRKPKEIDAATQLYK